MTEQGYTELTNDAPPRQPGSRNRKVGWAVALLAGGAIAGGIVVASLPASAADTTPSANPSGAASAPAAGQPVGPGGGRGGAAGGQRSDETVLTGADAEKATAAALKALPGATVDRVETDADGAVYEAHVTKSDGSKATVKFDKDFNVTATEDGMGAGGPGRGHGGGPGGAPKPAPSATN
jgi:hypothetical protein